MRKKLIIVGAGADSRNLAELVSEQSREWTLLGFLDDDPAKHGTKINGVPVLGKIKDAINYVNCYFVVLIGNYSDYFIRKRCVTSLPIGLENYATIVHSSAWVSKWANIGRGSAIYPGTTVMANAEIGNHVFIASKTNIGHDTVIGDYTSMSAMVGVAGRVVVGEGCIIGISSSIREGVTVGEWSIVGMGSVVVSDVPPYHVVAGNPARILKKLDPAKFHL